MMFRVPLKMTFIFVQIRPGWLMWDDSRELKGR